MHKFHTYINIYFFAILHIYMWIYFHNINLQQFFHLRLPSRNVYWKIDRRTIEARQVETGFIFFCFYLLNMHFDAFTIRNCVLRRRDRGGHWRWRKKCLNYEYMEIKCSARYCEKTDHFYCINDVTRALMKKRFNTGEH